MNQMTVNYEAIANGIYEMFDDNEKACLAFGMLPAVKMESLRKHLENKFTELNPNPLEILNAELKDQDRDAVKWLTDGVEDAWKKERKDWTQETEHKICLALYRVAPMVV
jgi:hypothetical protein